MNLWQSILLRQQQVKDVGGGGVLGVTFKVVSIGW